MHEIVRTRIRYGYRRVHIMLRREGWDIGRNLVYRIYREEGLVLRTKRPRRRKMVVHREARILPKLPNEAWSLDFIHDELSNGQKFRALTVVDWFSRKVLSWRLSITIETDFCIEAVEEAIHLYGKPEIFNTDQGSQFTSTDFTSLLIKNEIAISMDGKAAWRDNVFVERLWRTIKYEEVYLRAYANVPEARASLGRYIDGFYNTKRPHSSLDRKTPDEVYFSALPAIPLAA